MEASVLTVLDAKEVGAKGSKMSAEEIENAVNDLNELLSQKN